MDLDWEGTLVQRLDLSSDLDSVEKLEQVIVGFSDGRVVGKVIGVLNLGSAEMSVSLFTILSTSTAPWVPRCRPIYGVFNTFIQNTVATH